MTDWSQHLHAIDVAHYQGRINWAAVKAAGVHCAWIKIGGADDGTYSDSMAATNLANAAAAGLPYGTYYFAHPHTSDELARLQAQDAVRRGHGKGECLPALDLETNPTGMTKPALDAWTLAFVQEVERLTGRTSIIYTGAYTGIGHNNPATGRPYTPQLGRYPLWIANYPTNKPGFRPTTTNGPPIPAAWNKWAVWQHNAVTSVPGIVGDVDQDIIDPDFWSTQNAGTPPLTQRGDLLMKRFIVQGEPAQMRLVDDGNGVLRRQVLPNPRRADLLRRAGMVEDDLLVLSDPEDIREFNNIPLANEQGSDVAALRLTANIITEIRTATERVMADGAQVTDTHDGHSMNAAEVAEKVAEELSERLQQ